MNESEIKSHPFLTTPPEIHVEILEVSIIADNSQIALNENFCFFTFWSSETNSIPIYKGPALNRGGTACEVIIPIYIHIDTLKVLRKCLRDTGSVCVSAFVIGCESDILRDEIQHLKLFWTNQVSTWFILFLGCFDSFDFNETGPALLEYIN